MIGLLVAVLGLVALAAVLRTRWRVRHSLYAALWLERRQQLEEVRRRARGVQASARQNEVDSPELETGDIRVRESLRHALAGNLALAGALVTILLGVAILLASR